MKHEILVLGSLNVDLTVTTTRFHQPGETVEGSAFSTYPGGKGGNQAVAAARLGARVRMAGALGADNYGVFYRQVLAGEGISDRLVQEVSAPTGVALIQVDQAGENRIIVVPGANAMVNAACVEIIVPNLPDVAIALMQLEIPLDTVIKAAHILHQHGVPVMLDPAPARALPGKLYACIDYITPNRTELGVLTGLPTDTMDNIEKAAQWLLKQGARAVIAKLGADGCLFINRDARLHVPGFTVDVVDTTAAGDSFNAGLAYALVEGYAMPDALRFANAVGALSTTAAGAQAAMPTLASVKQMIAATESP